MSQQQQPSTGGYPPVDNSFVDKTVLHQQPPITSYPPVLNYNNQQQPPVQNYPAATTSNYNNPMMNNQQQQPQVQNYQPASTTNVAADSNFFMGHPINRLPSYTNTVHHQQPPITSYPPVWNNNNQQQAPLQNYPAATTSNYNNPMMNNQQQQPPVQNYQPASTTNVAAGSNFFMGHPINRLPSYTKTVAVIGSQYCSPNPFDLIITRKMMHLSSGNFIVEDVNGNLLFKVKDGIQLIRDRRVLLDAEGKPVVTMQGKIMSAHHKWNVFKGDSREPKDQLFCVKETSIIQLRTKLDVFLASNGNEGIGDFRVEGSWGDRSCRIYGGDSKTIIAQMLKKTTIGSVLVGKDKFTVTVYPNIDCAFIVALLVIVDDINRQVI